MIPLALRPNSLQSHLYTIANRGEVRTIWNQCVNLFCQSPLRIYVWVVLLDAPIMPTDEYLGLIHRGASPAYSKIRNDTFRTLTTDPLFRRRVSEASLIRLLNAIAWRLHDSKEEQRQSSRPSSSHSSVPRQSLGGSVSGHSQASKSIDQSIESRGLLSYLGLARLLIHSMQNLALVRNPAPTYRA